MAGDNYYRNKLALIIGGSEGIGLAIAVGLVGRGADVIIASRSEGKLANALAALKGRCGESQRVASVVMDVRDASRVQKQMDRLVADFGVPDLLINCAGVAYPGYIESLEVERYREMMEINYLGAVHTVKAVVPHMMRRRSGQILNVSSIAGFLGLFGYTGYCASKFAVIGFSEALCRELAPYGIKVSVLCPPNTRTPGLQRENQYKPAEVLATEEKVKVLEPEEVAQAALAALAKRRFMIIPSFDGKLAYYLGRYLPGVLGLFVRRPTLK